MWKHIRIVSNIVERTAGILVKKSREIAPSATISGSVRTHI
jgi:hypothetical protein